MLSHLVSALVADPSRSDVRRELVEFLRLANRPIPANVQNRLIHGIAFEIGNEERAAINRVRSFCEIVKKKSGPSFCFPFPDGFNLECANEFRIGYYSIWRSPEEKYTALVCLSECTLAQTLYACQMARKYASNQDTIDCLSRIAKLARLYLAQTAVTTAFWFKGVSR